MSTCPNFTVVKTVNTFFSKLLFFNCTKTLLEQIFTDGSEILKVYLKLLSPATYVGFFYIA